jgi:aminoglycoside phosphotransferase (APT) family kinase protein
MAQDAGDVVEAPPAQGVRRDWSAVPERIRHAFEAWAGSPVVAAISQPGGFSPGVAARLRLADGRGLFVKAVASEPNPTAPRFHRREARIVRALPPSLPVPRLRWFHDDGEGSWVVLAFDEVHGRHPSAPWLLDELQRILDGLADLAQRLTPSPLSLEEVGSVSKTVATTICGWQQLRVDPPQVVSRLDAWSRHHLETLAELESEAPDAVRGDALLHSDIRADNILLDTDRVWFFDWPHARVGAAWFDLACFLPSVTMQGGPPAEDVFGRSPTGRAADPEAVTRGVAAVAGFFTRQSLLPPVPGLPTLRAFQAAQAVPARQWLAARTGLR